MAETRFECPHCGRAGSTSRAIPAGARARCPGCRESFRIEPIGVAEVARPGRSAPPRATLAGPLAPAVDPFADLELERPTPPPVESVAAPGPTAAVAPKRKKRRGGGKLGTTDRDGWIALGIGLGLAVVALAVPLIGFVIHVLIVVIHELGHTATAWLFASPALPSFDLSYGGGVSLILPRQPVLIAAAYAVFAFMLFRAREDRRELGGWAVGLVLYSVAMGTPLRGLLITAMGHGAELLFAGIFLYRALSGTAVLRHEERPLYAALAFFILLGDARFAYNLMSSDAHRAAYGDAKAGGHAMDFDLIARDDLHCRLETVAGLFLVACALTPVAAFLGHRYARRLI